MDVGRVLFLGVAFATHGVVGYALVHAFTTVDPRIGFVVGVVPDADFLFPAAWGWPFVHRGITHSPVFTIAVVVGAYAIYRRREAVLAAGLPLLSHQAIDSFSPTGIAWTYPFEPFARTGESTLSIALSTFEVGSAAVGSLPAGLPVHGPAGTVVLWGIALALLLGGSRRPMSSDTVV